ncbi:hypothetical protein AGMMS50243_10770 [Betaproteobacteria bacterium]|nr:hypothetical protein AGMMS50243_10770 [Betaproteobacteria bacterium]
MDDDIEKAADKEPQQGDERDQEVRITQQWIIQQGEHGGWAMKSGRRNKLRPGEPGRG